MVTKNILRIEKQPGASAFLEKQILYIYRILTVTIIFASTAATITTLFVCVCVCVYIYEYHKHYETNNTFLSHHFFLLFFVLFISFWLFGSSWSAIIHTYTILGCFNVSTSPKERERESACVKENGKEKTRIDSNEILNSILEQNLGYKQYNTIGCRIFFFYYRF